MLPLSIVEMNTAAEDLLSRSQVLAVRHGKLVAMEAVEAKQLATLIARAGNANAADGRILVGQANSRLRHLLTVFPLEGKLAPGERATVAIRISWRVRLQAQALLTCSGSRQQRIVSPRG